MLKLNVARGYADVLRRSNQHARVGFVKDYQRLNVALTRARHALIAVGDASTLGRSESEDLREFIRDVRSRDVLFSEKKLQL